MREDPESATFNEQQITDVISANAAFYSAFEQMDMEAMGRIWRRDEADICVHPGWEVLTGWASIRGSWAAIFANTGYIRIRPDQIQVEILGSTARLTCVENFFTVAGGQTIHSRVAATHLFVETPEGWRLCLHHGSPIASEIDTDSDELEFEPLEDEDLDLN